MNEIKNEDDIKFFMNKCGGFHDSCIVSVNYSSGAFVDENKGMGNGELSEHTLLLTVHSQWCDNIELLFKGVRKFSVVGWQDNYFCDIYSAYLDFRTDLLGKCRDDRLIVWADDGSFKPAYYTEERLISDRNITYVIAEKLFWKIKNDNEQQ